MGTCQCHSQTVWSTAGKLQRSNVQPPDWEIGSGWRVGQCSSSGHVCHSWTVGPGRLARIWVELKPFARGNADWGLTSFPGKAWHVLFSSGSGCCFLIDCQFLGYFCQSVHPFDVAIGQVNWSRILLNANTWTTRLAMWVYYNCIVEQFISIHDLIFIGSFRLINLNWDNRIELINQKNTTWYHIDKFCSNKLCYIPHNFISLCFNNCWLFEHRTMEKNLTFYHTLTNT